MYRFHRLCSVLALGALPWAVAWAQSGAPCQVRTPGLQGSYVGDCVGGLASGKGRARGTDAYEGSFRNGQPTGYGIYTFADGRRFEGEFLDGKVNGRARFTYSSGDVLEGVFKDNTLTGTGRMQRASGEALLVQLQAGGLVVVGPAPAQPAAPATAPATTAPVPGSTPAPAATPTPATAPAATPAAQDAAWSARLDFEDFFPSYIFATATRKPPPPQGGASRSASSSRGDPLAEISAADFVRGRDPAPGGRARFISNAGNATYLGDPWGLVGIRFNNTVPGTQVTLRVQVDEIAETTEVSFDLQKTGEHLLYPKLKYRYDKLRLVNQPIPVNVSWTVFVNGRNAGTQSAVARVRSVQDAPLSVQTTRGDEKLLWVMASFVTEDAPWLDELVRDAFAGSKVAAVGYQEDGDGVDRQVQAVYQMLRKRGVHYSSITKSSGMSDKVFSQIVRLPSDSIRTAQANCVDGTVLMASLLRKIGVEPIIVTGPGHALLGYFRTMATKEKKAELRFVETTMIGGADFPAAQSVGGKQVNEWAEKSGEDPRFQLIPVFWARQQGVTPIPR